MTESPHAEDPKLLSVASTIAQGDRVDWNTLSPGSETETATLEQLRVLESLSRLSDPIPNAWGPFTITGEIGKGAFGTVYRAVDPSLNLEVALKVIRPRGTATTFDAGRGLHEARLLAKVNHPNVVRVFRAEHIGREVGLSMELVKGRTLHDVVRQHGPLSGDETMLVGLEVCRALAAVHAAGLVHGDVKAANVMRAERGRTVLMDFGAGDDLARDPDDRRPVTGTPLYLAPELFGGGGRTRVADIYSVGVLLYYLSTGSYPIEGQSGADVERQHATPSTRRLLRDVRPDLPDAFVTVVNRATAERPEDRYQTAGELASALKQALGRDDRAAIVHSVSLFTWRRGLTATAAVLAVGLGYWIWNPRSQSGDDVSRVSEAPTAAAATSAAPLAEPYRIEAAFYREVNGATTRLQAGARIAPGDRISLQVTTSIPTYVFVVNEDERGAGFLLFPLPGQAQSNPLRAGQRHDLPGIVDGERLAWRVSTAGGHEHFLIFASPEPPSADLDRVFASLPHPTVESPAVPVTADLGLALRGVGGLAKAPVQPSSAGLNREFTVPLPTGEETVQGVWVRRLTLENPVK